MLFIAPRFVAPEQFDLQIGAVSPHGGRMNYVKPVKERPLEIAVCEKKRQVPKSQNNPFVVLNIIFVVLMENESDLDRDESR